MRRRTISLQTRFRVLQRCKNRCSYCGRPASKVELHLDHVISLANGGTDEEWNLTAACIDCNLGKADISIIGGKLVKRRRGPALSRTAERWTKITAEGLWPSCHPDDPCAEPNRSQIEAARTWLRACCKQRGCMSRHLTSYTYKHYVEGWSRNGDAYRYIDNDKQCLSDFQYVSNGAFIVAAKEEGYIVERSRPRSMNAFFNLTLIEERTRKAPHGYLVAT